MNDEPVIPLFDVEAREVPDHVHLRTFSDFEKWQRAEHERMFAEAIRLFTEHLSERFLLAAQDMDTTASLIEGPPQQH